MPEPTSTAVGAASIAATASALSLALFGVDYYSLLYGLVGALLALGHAEQMGRARAIVYVLLSMLAGAVIGNVAVEYLQLRTRYFVIGFCLVGGLLAQVAAGVALRVAPSLIEAGLKRFGFGSKGERT